MWKAPAGEGAPAKICELPPGIVLGLAWRADRTILFNMAYGPRGGEIFAVPDTGGTPERRPIPGTPAEKVPAVFDLRGLPDGSITYTQMQDGKAVTILERDGAEPKVLNVPANFGLTYSASGHLLYSRRDEPGVFAIHFDLKTALATGEPFRVVENGTGPSASADGTLAYSRAVAGVRQLTWVDRDGTPRGIIGQPQDSMWSPAVSPDATRVAVAGVERGTPNIWTHEIGRAAKSRLTFEGVAVDPAWHPSSARIAFQTGGWDVLAVGTDGGAPEGIVAGPDPEYQPIWSRDARYLVFGRFSPKTLADIWVLETGMKEPQAIVNGPFNEGESTVSPDGKYFAYQSDETGRNEIFVRTFPEGQGRKQVSFGGGVYPRWSPKGNEIFYVEGTVLMAAPVRTAPTFSADAPKRLFDLEDRAAGLRVYDTPDGQRFVVVQTQRPPRNGVVVTQNWIKEFAGR